MLKMTSMRFNAGLDKSHHGSAHPFKDAGVVADSVTDIHNAIVKCLLLSTTAAYTMVLGKNPEDSNVARLEATQ
jgi:hypothetical protein